MSKNNYWPQYSYNNYSPQRQRWMPPITSSRSRSTHGNIHERTPPYNTRTGAYQQASTLYPRYAPSPPASPPRPMRPPNINTSNRSHVSQGIHQMTSQNARDIRGSNNNVSQSTNRPLNGPHTMHPYPVNGIPSANGPSQKPTAAVFQATQTRPSMLASAGCDDTNISSQQLSRVDQTAVAAASETAHLESSTRAQHVQQRQLTSTEAAQRLGATHDTTLEKPRSSFRIPVGLQNTGNTCYFNSVVQVLNQTLILEKLLRDSSCPTTSNYQKGITHQLKELYNAMQNANGFNRGSTVNPRALLSEIARRSNRFQGFQQQDSHELLRHLMDGVKEEEKERTTQPGKPAVVDQVFGGHFITVYHCESCHTPYHLIEPFLDLSLPVACWATRPQSTLASRFNLGKTNAVHVDNNNTSDAIYSTQTADTSLKTLDSTNVLQEVLCPLKPASSHLIRWNSVEDSLRFICRVEQLDEYLCLHCNSDRSDYLLTRGNKQTLVLSPPAILTVHLKRFEQTPTGRYKKVDKEVHFESELDLSPFCSKYALRRSASIKYSLYGVILHNGSLSGGHYKARVKINHPDIKFLEQFIQTSSINREQLMDRARLADWLNTVGTVKQTVANNSSQSNDCWYKISDSRVQTTTWSKVEKHNKDVYMLFYERVN